MADRFLLGLRMVITAMRKLIIGSLLSLNGVHHSPQAWASPHFDDTAAQESLEQLNRTDAMLMGRTTYEYFAASWPSATGPYAERVNSIRKYVFSSTLREVTWTGATLVDDDPAVAVAKLKNEGDGDLVVYGYGQLGQTLLEAGLVDEFNVSFHPAVVDGSGPTSLELASVRQRPNGVLVASYRPGT